MRRTQRIVASPTPSNSSIETSSTASTEIDSYDSELEEEEFTPEERQRTREIITELNRRTRTSQLLSTLRYNCNIRNQTLPFSIQPIIRPNIINRSNSLIPPTLSHNYDEIIKRNIEFNIHHVSR
mgnify:CR=1 FL=1